MSNSNLKALYETAIRELGFRGQPKFELAKDSKAAAQADLKAINDALDRHIETNPNQAPPASLASAKAYAGQIVSTQFNNRTAPGK